MEPKEGREHKVIESYLDIEKFKLSLEYEKNKWLFDYNLNTFSIETPICLKCQKQKSLSFTSEAEWGKGTEKEKSLPYHWVYRMMSCQVSAPSKISFAFGRNLIDQIL